MPDETVVIPEETIVMPEETVVIPEETVVIPEEIVVIPEETVVIKGKAVNIPEILVNMQYSSTLNYVTRPVQPTKNNTVTIRLPGSNTEKDACNNRNEVSGKKELNLYKDSKAGNAKGQLRIVEAEFFEKVE